MGCNIGKNIYDENIYYENYMIIFVHVKELDFSCKNDVWIAVFIHVKYFYFTFQKLYFQKIPYFFSTISKFFT